MKLDEEQQVKARAVLQQHLERFAAFIDEAKPLRDRLMAHMNSLPISSVARTEALLESERLLAEVADRQEVLDQQTLDAWQSVLTDEQLEIWPRFMNNVHRGQWRNRPWLFVEEQIDLIQIVDDVLTDHPEIAQGGEIQSLLQAYAAHMDERLAALAKASVAFARTFDRTRRWAQSDDLVVDMGSMPGDGSPHEKWMSRQVQWHKPIRAINRQYLSMVQAILPETLQAALQDHYTSAWLDNYVPPGALQAGDWFERVLVCDTLTNEQRRDIDSLIQQYRVECQSKSDAILKAQALEAETRFISTTKRHEESQAALKAAVDQRLKVEKRFIETIALLLTDSQRAQIPPPR